MAENSSQVADVLVIGGGIIGCSIAWRLARTGMNVRILDRSQPGAEASSAAAGMLAPLGEMVEPDHFSDLCIASRRLYPQFVAEIEEATGHRTGYRGDGTLLVAQTPDEEWELRRVHRTQAGRGFDMQPLTAGGVRACAPDLSPDMQSGLFIPDDHWIDNEKLMDALLLACRRAGVGVEAGNEVQTFHRHGDRIESLTTGSGITFAARTYVLAAGAWSGLIAEKLGMRLPVTACRGQMLEFEVRREWPCVVRSGIHYLVPRSDRRLLVGTTAEYTGLEKVVTASGLLSVLQGAAALTPSIGDFRLLRAWAGLRPDTADHLPILGLGSAENLLLATGHFRNGILLAPVTAEIIAELVLNGSSSRPTAHYSPARFAPSGSGSLPER